MGKVVDNADRVLGVSSLRVVDGSTFRIPPGTNPQATVMMMGRYVGEKILETRNRGGEWERCVILSSVKIGADI
ncbi:(R)-mandelonitrile lyase-like [Thalictrum thalictroides]|uniref:(R)-mandelonitrile lyase-like n=1 Tax=Thalictrum thalictroides TaxID=46969 RepID=A0A7J6UUL8_THATH|nr:(R)-mandelonitrile lyase-like [Thalictrum thalictroides]